MQGMREYEVIRDGNVFGTSFSSSGIFSSEYEEARQQLESLLSRYHGRSFESVFHGTETVNEGGVCFVQKSLHDLAVRPVDPDRFREDILQDLTLVRGIGPATRKKLNAQGYGTIPDLIAHPGYRSVAEDVLSRLTDGSSAEIMDLIGVRHSKSHHSILGTTGMHKPEDFVFFDIETLGLFSRPIILLGIGSLENGRLLVHQYLLRDIEDEQAALLATVDHLSGEHPALVTFNGKAFDLPYLADRLAYYGLGSPSRAPHFDMLHFSRRRWKGKLSSLRLSALEKEILGISRSGDIPGAMVPEFYEAYQRSGNCGPLVPIVDHNRQDVVSLALLFFHLVGESYGGT
jgi:uncharacterized protein YprB with RNaseH-like and TPR domain